ncbi:MAG: DMT family transporter [Candidatus Pacebacteria bacterium]|jgi:drug/metabolite transporter (DMT)-like permease|nr:DMT family transporter [Candidatus Paceibacterota bacterium]MBT3512219.1 DMT family transporter [Candidatus Paceibacterota bacterium]MBT4004551.1 DMT family transporter [Candidatus Paceibacterota bacterium]MBT4359201.1 DMT family transporter [Candidatus Paceibacterota bacterium]MBT4681087.1 DMT family transporter [Candidatus Paceibacterota bacterium]
MIQAIRKAFSSPLFLMVLAAITGASTPVAAKYALEAFQPFTIVALRFFFASLFLLPLILRSKELSLDKFKKLFFVSVIGSINPILLFIALQFTQASFSPLIYAGVPAMTAAYMILVQKHQINSRKLMGIALGFLGVGTIVVLPLLENADNISAFGNTIIFLASIAFLSYGLLSKKKQKELNVSPLALTFYFSLVSLLLSLPFMGYELLSLGFSAQISIVHILSTVYIGLVGTGVFYLAYQYALKHGSAVNASLFTYLQPIFGISLAALILGEKITLPFVIGGAVAIIGAQLASSKK